MKLVLALELADVCSVPSEPLAERRLLSPRVRKDLELFLRRRWS